MDSRRRQDPRFLVGLLVAALSAGGCGASTIDAGQALTDTSPEFVAGYDVVGGSGPEEALLSETVTKTRPPGLKTVEIGPIPEDAVPRGAEAETVPGTKWLTFEYAVGDNEGAVVEAFWRGAVAATGYRRAAEEQGLPLIRGYTIRSQTADGEVVQNEVATISETAFKWNGKPPVTDVEALRARLRGEIAVGVKVISFEVAEPYGAAPVITLEISDPEALFDEDESELPFVPDLDPFEGYLIRVVDTNGGLVWMGASANRAGAGVGWTRPDLQGET